MATTQIEPGAAAPCLVSFSPGTERRVLLAVVGSSSGDARLHPFHVFQLTGFWKENLPALTATLASWLPGRTAGWGAQLLCALAIFAGTCGVRLLAHDSPHMFAPLHRPFVKDFTIGLFTQEKRWPAPDHGFNDDGAVQPVHEPGIGMLWQVPS